MGYSPWDPKEAYMTEVAEHTCMHAQQQKGKKDCGFKSQPLSSLFSAFLTTSEFSLILYLVSFQPGSKGMNEITP